MKRAAAAVLAFLLLFTSACQATSPSDLPAQVVPDVTESGTQETVVTSIEPTNPSDPAPTAALTTTSTELHNTAEPIAVPPPDPLRRTSYTFDVLFDYGYFNLSINETVNYVNRSDEEINDLLLVVEQNKQPGVFRMNSITWEDGSPVAGAVLEGRRLSFPLLQPLMSGETILFSITYDLFLPPIPPPEETDRPIYFGYTPRQVNLVDWYPYVPPYQAGQGWLVHDLWYFAEHQVYDKSDFDVSIRTQNAPESLVIASSGAAEQDGETTRYQISNSRTFAWSASPEYQVSSQQVGDVTIYSYYFPYTKDAGEAALIDTAAALELYSRLYSPYPHKTLSVIEADFFDGMEFEGLYFLSRGFYNLYDGSPRGYLTAIAVHETAHQWWYGSVSSDQALEPWLDEALCTYSELLYYENVHPLLVEWWWSFRVDFFDPQGPVNGSIYDYNGFRPYVNAVYLRGARFLSDLRSLIGDEAFFAFIRDYASTYAGGFITREDFFSLLSQHTDKDINPLIDLYFSK